jgi:hypothetical protein
MQIDNIFNLLEAATAVQDVPLRINSVKVAGPVLRVSSFAGNRGVMFVDNVIIEGTLHPHYFIMDSDQTNFDCNFEIDRNKLKQYKTHCTITKEHVRVKSVNLKGHSASGSVNWNMVTVSPPMVMEELRRMKGLVRSRLLEYLKANKEKLVQQLNGILPSVLTFLP